jgi:hypothetical protein
VTGNAYGKAASVFGYGGWQPVEKFLRLRENVEDVDRGVTRVGQLIDARGPDDLSPTGTAPLAPSLRCAAAPM